MSVVPGVSTIEARSCDSFSSRTNKLGGFFVNFYSR